MLRLRFVAFQTTLRQGPDSYSPNLLWKVFYRPPWLLVLHILEIAQILLATQNVIAITTNSLYHQRDVFVHTLLRKESDITPLSSLPHFTAFAQYYSDSLEHILKYSFGTITFGPSPHALFFSIQWLNGSISLTPTLNLSLEAFHHVSSITFAANLISSTSRHKLTGCTNWTIQTRFFRPIGSPVFKSDSSIAYGNTDTCLHTPRVVPIFRYYSITLLLLSLISFVLILRKFLRSFLGHLYSLKHNLDYQGLDLFDQIHQTIGFWIPLFLISQLLAICSSIEFLFDLQNISQFPSQKSLLLFGLTSLFIISCFLRWLQPFPKIYRVVLIIRFGLKRLISLLVGQFPLIFSMTFVTIFLFGFVNEITYSVQDIIELLISITFGDYLYSTFACYTDLSESYNIISTITVALFVAVTIWLFFSTYTAAIVFIDHRFIAKVVGD